MTLVTRRSFAVSFGFEPITGSLAGCTGGGAGIGTLAIHVPDQPGDIGDFEKLLIQIGGNRLKTQDGETQQKDADSEGDLTELTGEATSLIVETELESTSYEFLQLKADSIEATLSDGDSSTVDIPGDAPLKFEMAFEIPDGETTTFIADITLFKQGQTGQSLLQTVASDMQVIYEDNE